MRKIDPPLLRVAIPFFFWFACAIILILIFIFPSFLGGPPDGERDVSSLVTLAFCELVSLRFVWIDALQLRFWHRVSVLRRRYMHEAQKDVPAAISSSLSVPLELQARWNSLLNVIIYVIVAPLVIAGLLIFLFVYHGSLLNLVLILLCVLVVVSTIAYMYGSNPVLNTFYQRIYIDHEGITVTVFLRKANHLSWSDARAFMSYYPYESSGAMMMHNSADSSARALYELSSERRTVYWNWRTLAPLLGPSKIELPSTFKNANQCVEQFNLFIMEKTGLPLHELDTADVMAKPSYTREREKA